MDDVVGIGAMGPARSVGQNGTFSKFMVRAALTAACTATAILLGKVDIITGVMGDTASCLLSTVFPLLAALLLSETNGRTKVFDVMIIIIVAGLSLGSLGALIGVSLRQ